MTLLKTMKIFKNHESIYILSIFVKKNRFIVFLSHIVQKYVIFRWSYVEKCTFALFNLKTCEKLLKSAKAPIKSVKNYVRI